MQSENKILSIMGDKIAISLASIAVFASFALISYKYFHQESVTVNTSLERVNIDIDSLYYPEVTAKLAAVFVIDGRVCPPCLVEIDEYISILSEDVNQYGVQPVIILIGDSEEQANKFIKRANLPIPIQFRSYGDLPEGFYNLDLGFINRQLIIVDTKTGKGVYRTRLPNNYITPMEKKQANLSLIRDLA